MTTKKSFFISYTQSDEEWAAWIDETLKSAGHTTILQACDRGMEEKIDFALKNSECFIAVMSKEYQDSPYCRQTWTSAYKKNTDYEKTLSETSEPVKPMFIPAKVEDVKQEGLLATRNYISLYRYGKNDQKAKDLLLDAIKPRPFARPVELTEIPSFAEKKDVINNLPFARNLYFLGRTEILNSINKNLKSNCAVSLVQHNNNLIGVGKTSIALEYAYLHENKYETLWWVNAENSSNVLNSYKTLALHKQIISENAKDDDVVKAMKFWFNNNKEWLFIYDNASKDDFKWLEAYLPQSFQPNKNTHVLITTRNNFFPKCKSLINVPAFNESESIAFLKKRIDKSDEDYSDDSAKTLAEHLQYMPLALEQAATYIEQNAVTYQDCIALIKKYGADIFKKQLTGGK
jgi:hypothetical protein